MFLPAPLLPLSLSKNQTNTQINKSQQEDQCGQRELNKGTVVGDKDRKGRKHQILKCLENLGKEKSVFYSQCGEKSS